MRIVLTLGVLLLVLLLLVACMPGPNALARTPDEQGHVAGFWQGLWQGIIAPITFIVSLFTPNVQFYEVHNNGN
jgi:Spy/CpxP family protein refolding chaperone